MSTAEKRHPTGRRPRPHGGAVERSTRRRLARELALASDGVVSRRMLAAAGITRHDVRYQVKGGRWRPYGQQTVAVHNGPLGLAARRWAAVFETGATIAAIDGVTALQHAGLTGYEDDQIHISAVHNHNTDRLSGVTTHKVIRRVSGELRLGGLPHPCPEVAAIRAAHWARSDRQAALILLMTVQQRLTTPARLAAAQRVVRGRTRRSFIRSVVRDIAFGVQSLGELDFARLCRSRGLPSRRGRSCARRQGAASTSTSPGTATTSSWRSTVPSTGGALR